MEKVVDLHLHSRFARATSKSLTIKNIYKWCKIKGINVIGTGDFTHPRWFAELNEFLVPAENGLYRLKENEADIIDRTLPESVRSNEVRFILSVEISNIYSKYGKARRLHNLIVMRDFSSAEKLISKLSKIGNINADGRPIIGLDSKELLRMTIETDPSSIFIPAHIWTPWFSMFGSKSGFNTIEEAFEELTPEIKAIETGLSSDPYMNWRLSRLDKLTIVSNSDSHSLFKMGREANLIDMDFGYSNIETAIKTNNKNFLGTIEFFPQEGMYHLDGHRKCSVSFTPDMTKKYHGICPKCGKPLIIGVLNRVDELADRPLDYTYKGTKSVEYTIPLLEIIAEIKGVKSIGSTTVQNEYEKLYSLFGSEFNILRKISVEDLSNGGFQKLSMAIDKMRKRDVYIEPGYDGVYGIVKIFPPGEKDNLSGQLSLGIK